MKMLPTYTHVDKDGIMWRMEGGRPVSQIADEVMALCDEMGWGYDKPNGTYYRLNNNLEPESISIMQYIQGKYKVSKQVALTTIAGRKIMVSTVFLSLNLNLLGKHPPIVFETMVFGGSMNREQRRYSTYEDALIGHKAMVRRIIQADKLKWWNIAFGFPCRWILQLAFAIFACVMAYGGLSGKWPEVGLGLFAFAGCVLLVNVIMSLRAFNVNDRLKLLRRGYFSPTKNP